MIGRMILRAARAARRLQLRRTDVSSRSALCFLGVAAAFLPGCAASRLAPRPLPEKITAIWVTRYDYKTPEDVTTIIRNCADAGFNTVIFQVRGHGTAHYNSNFEPWDDSLGGKHPGWDPLELAITEAHARNMTLHAWVNVMPAWDGTTPPKNPDQLYNKRPEWFWYDQHGNRQAMSSFYVSLNPCLPEVRSYLVDVFRDIAARYNIDGLHMDYIRFPNEPPARPKGSGIDYPYDERTLALYKDATGKAPADDKQAWNEWRTGCVTQLVGDIHAMLRKTRPGAQLTASVGSVPKNALSHFQDGQRWTRDGTVEATFLMNYTPSPEEFEKRIDNWMRMDGAAASASAPASAAPKAAYRVIPGLSIGSHLKKPLAEVGRDVVKQIESARAKTGDVCVFAYTYLFDSADTGEISDASAKQREARRGRREVILPAIRGASPALVQ